MAAVAAALRDDFLTTGPKVEAFEQAFADFVGARHAVACANGTAALHLAVLALGVGEGDVCIVPSTTFLATANCARFVGAEVVFSDVDPLTGLMTPTTLAEAIEGDAVADASPPSCAVHLRGDVAELPALRTRADAADAALVEDACHALGSRMRFGGETARVGDNRYGALATFSFHPVKTLTTGEGGMVTTADAALATRLKTLRSHGMVRPAGAEPWWYEMSEPGFNYRLPDLLCAPLGLSQLRRLPAFIERRRDCRRAATRRHWAPLGADRAPRDAPGMVRSGPAPDDGAHRFRRRRPLPHGGDGGAEGAGDRLPGPLHPGPPPALLPGAATAIWTCQAPDAWYERCLSLPLYPRP